jgi:hypothetical protein
MSNQSALPGVIYIHDTGRSLCIQVRGPLSGALVPELLQVWETSRSIQQRVHVLDLKAAGPFSREGVKALDFLHASGVRLLWPEDTPRSQRRTPLLSALRTFFCQTVTCF